MIVFLFSATERASATAMELGENRTICYFGEQVAPDVNRMQMDDGDKCWIGHRDVMGADNIGRIAMYRLCFGHRPIEFVTAHRHKKIHRHQSSVA